VANKGKKGLNDRQLRFVQVYNGNATEAAKKAGYSPKTAYSQGQRLLKKDEIRSAIGIREVRASIRSIMTREERQEFWSKVANNEQESMKERLKASELLGRSQADFTDKVLVGGLEATLKDLDDEEIDRRIGQLDSQAAAVCAQMGKGQETMH